LLVAWFFGATGNYRPLLIKGTPIFLFAYN